MTRQQSKASSSRNIGPQTPKMKFSTALMVGQKQHQHEQNSHRSATQHQDVYTTTTTTVTQKQEEILIDPTLPDTLHAIEPFIAKARHARNKALSLQPPPLNPLPPSLRSESIINFSTSEYPIRDTFLEALGLSTDTNLERLFDYTCSNDDDDDNNSGKKTTKWNDKRKLTQNLLSDTPSRRRFQETIHRFVLDVIAKDIESASSASSSSSSSSSPPTMMISSFYFQIFPCLRIIHPGEFSIGPHADCAYGHFRNTINYYIPLTTIRNGNGLFVESYPGKEDWHDVVSLSSSSSSSSSSRTRTRISYGDVWRFHGGECLHWTSDNVTDRTRVSLDLRVIPRECYLERCRVGGGGGSGNLGGEQRRWVDQYVDVKGYYALCRRKRRCKEKETGAGEDDDDSLMDDDGDGDGDLSSSWEWCVRDDVLSDGANIDLEMPDRRVGFPFT